MQPDEEVQRQREYFAEKARAERAAEAAAFMEKNGLKTPEDCRAFARNLFAEFRHQGPSFDNWCRSMKQPAVDWLVRGKSQENVRLLQRLRDRAVIDENNKLIPLAERIQRAAQIQVERMQVEAELDRRRRPEPKIEEHRESAQ